MHFSPHIMHFVRLTIKRDTPVGVDAGERIYPFPPLWPKQHLTSHSFSYLYPRLHLFISLHSSPQSTYFFFFSSLPPATHPSSTSSPPPDRLYQAQHGRALHIHHSGQIKPPAMPANDHYYSLHASASSQSGPTGRGRGGKESEGGRQRGGLQACMPSLDGSLDHGCL